MEIFFTNTKCPTPVRVAECEEYLDQLYASFSALLGTELMVQIGNDYAWGPGGTALFYCGKLLTKPPSESYEYAPTLVYRTDAVTDGLDQVRYELSSHQDGWFRTAYACHASFVDKRFNELMRAYATEPGSSPIVDYVIDQEWLPAAIACNLKKDVNWQQDDLITLMERLVKAIQEDWTMSYN